MPMVCFLLLYTNVTPPSIVNDCPVTSPADATKLTTTSATSSGVATRSKRRRLPVTRNMVSFPFTQRVITIPGFTAFTLTSGASTRASDLVRLSNAAFEAA